MPAAYEFEHAVDVAASSRAAWEFWTRVENWKVDPHVEWVTIDGEFREGATGETKQQGQPPARWRVVEARPPERSVIAVELPGATARFEMSFEPVSQDASRLRQRITLEGPQAKLLASGLGPMFDEGVRMGMRRLADAIAKSREP